MSEDKYSSIFLPHMEAIVLIILQIFFATRAVLNPVIQPRDVCRPIAREQKYLMDYNEQYSRKSLLVS